MKQRVTYVVKKPELFSPEQLVLISRGKILQLDKVHAAKEHRLTVELDELPAELRAIFLQWRQLHVRWASSAAWKQTPPFTARVSPGLHIFYNPLQTTLDNALCENLRSTISEQIKCVSTTDSAVGLPPDVSSRPVIFQYYAYLDSISKTFASFRQQFREFKNGACEDFFNSLPSAAYMDIDYDTGSHTVVLTAMWSDAPDQEGWSEKFRLPGGDSVVEVGVLNHEANSDPDDIQFGGFLSVLGQDEIPKATRFQTPTRHYPLLKASASLNAPPKLHPLTYTTSFSHPTGLHPTLVLSFPKDHLEPPDLTCKLHTYVTLPSYLFIDRYQFEDALFLQSKNLKRLSSLVGATDLEAPDWVVQQWGSAALFELSHSDEQPRQNPKTYSSIDRASPEIWNISIPLHLRYMPALPSSHTRVPVPWPVVFWACYADEGANMAGNPFDRLHLGYEALFGAETRFMHVEPASHGNGTGQLIEWVHVPVLDTRKSEWVEIGTISMVSAAFLILCCVLFWNSGGTKVKSSKKKKKL